MTDQNVAATRVPLPADVSVLPHEKVMKVARFHWGIYWKGGMVMALAILLGLYVPNLGIFGMCIATAMLGVSYVTKHFMLLILTNKRLLIRTGLLRMDTVQMSLERIESVELERTIPGLLMGYASVVVTGTGSRVMAIPYVDEAYVFRRLTDEQIYAETHKPKEGN